jgi:aminoglycoside phosphotransferase
VAWTSTVPGPGGPDLVFCHGDLSQTNILVDPETLKIQGIIDWEFAGFWPEYFEEPHFRDPVPSGAQFTDLAANAKLVAFLQSQGHED